MQISQIVQPDAQSVEFARRHAAVHVRPISGDGGFADYLAATMNAGRAPSEAGELSRASEHADDSRSALLARSEEHTRTRDRDDEDRSQTNPVNDPEPDDDVTHSDQSREVTGREESVPESRETVGSERVTDDASGSDKPDAGLDEETPGVESARGGQSARPLRGRGGDRVDDAGGRRPADVEASDRGIESERRAGGLTIRRPSEDLVEIDVEVKDLSRRDEPVASDAKGSSRSPRERLLRDAASMAGDPEKSGLRADRAGDGDRRSNRRSEPADEAREDRRVEVRDHRAANRSRPGSTGEPGSDSGTRRDGGESSRSGYSVDQARGATESRTSDPSGHFETLRTDSSGPGASVSRNAATPNAAAAADLRHALQEQLNGEIVRSARLVVRGNDSGEIRLHLKPEHLGDVRISLRMHDGHIAGRIIVDNQTVREVFEQNLASLQKAFQESGLEAGGVEISLADSGNHPDGQTGGSPERAVARDAAVRFGHSVPDLSWFEDQHDLVDMVV